MSITITYIFAYIQKTMLGSTYTKIFDDGYVISSFFTLELYNSAVKESDRFGTNSPIDNEIRNYNHLAVKYLLQ